MNRRDHDDHAERRGSGSSGLTMLFFVVGSLFNLMALVLLVGNIINLTRQWLSGTAVTLGGELLAPLGAFLIGVICYLIANSFE
jgi:hypothetical protein